MRPIGVMITLVALLFSSMAHAGVAEDRVNAAFIEWYVANCGMDGLPAMVPMIAAMVINGSQASDLEEPRRQVRESISRQFADTNAACADLKAHYNSNAGAAKK